MKKSKTLLLTFSFLLIVGVFCSCASQKTPDSNKIDSTNTTTTTTNTTSTNATVKDESSTTTTTAKPTAKAEVKKTTTTAKKTTTTAKQAHKHTYTTKVVKATCSKGGYTLHSCSCGHSYKDKTTSKLGHSYGSWTVKKQATVSATGSKERKCSRCGYVQKQSIPKKQQQSAGSIDSRVTVGTAKYGSTPMYSLGKCRVNDVRTWGSRPAITVYNGDCMQVTYYNKQNQKVTFNVEPVSGYINAFTILNDGTYVSQLFGSYS